MYLGTIPFRQALSLPAHPGYRILICMTAVREPKITNLSPLQKINVTPEQRMKDFFSIQFIHLQPSKHWQIASSQYKDNFASISIHALKVYTNMWSIEHVSGKQHLVGNGPSQNNCC